MEFVAVMVIDLRPLSDDLPIGSAGDLLADIRVESPLVVLL